MRRDIQVVSLPVDFPLWGTVRTHRGTPRASAWCFLLLVLGMGVVAGWRGWGWLLAWGLLYLGCLGPWACWSTNVPFDFVIRDGRTVLLPLYGLVEPMQDWVGFIKPLRLYPHIQLVTAILLVLGVDRLLVRVEDLAHHGAPAWLPARLRSLGGTPARRRGWVVAATVLLPLLACLPKLQLLLEPVPGFSRLSEFRPHPFFLELAEEEADDGLIELPLGLGHSSAPQQLVHGRVRADAHADDFGALQLGQAPRAGCFAQGLVLDLWGFGCEREAGWERINRSAPQVRAASAASAVFTPGAVRRALDQGFGRLVVYPEAYRSLEVESDGTLRCDLEALELALVGVLGEPTHRDDQLWAWSLADSALPSQ